MRQAAELDCSDAYYELAEMYRLGDGTETNRARAKTWYEKAVETNAKNASLAAEKLNLY
jgi:TPR repeat protein